MLLLDLRYEIDLYSKSNGKKYLQSFQEILAKLDVMIDLGGDKYVRTVQLVTFYLETSFST